MPKITRFRPLSENIPAPEHEENPRGEEACLAAEICRSLIEWREKESRTRPVRFLRRLMTLQDSHPDGFWLVVRMMSGDVDEVLRSLAEQGQIEGCSKQAVHQKQSRIMEAIDAAAIVFPNLTETIRKMQHRSGGGPSSGPS